MDIPAHDLKNLTQRLHRLERQNRRARQIAIFVVASLAAILLMGQKGFRNRTLEAERFILKDLSGNRRAELLMEAAGPGLVIYDTNGNRIGRFGATGPGNGAGLSLQKPDGGSRATLISLPDGPHLLLFDGNGKFRTEIGANIKGPFLFLNDSSERLRMALVVESEAPRLQMSDQEGYSAVLGSEALVSSSAPQTQRTRASSLMLFGKDREIIWKAP